MSARRFVVVQDSEKDLELMYLLANNPGSKVHISVRDNAALGKNAANIGGFSAELCDRGLFLVNVVLFFFPEHGKSDVDKLFGAIEQLLANWSIFSQDQACAALPAGAPLLARSQPPPPPRADFADRRCPSPRS